MPADAKTPAATAPSLPSLPFELISHILGFLPLGDLLPLSTVCRTVRFVCADPTVTPFPRVLGQTLDAGPPYPRALAVLGTYSHVPRRAFLPVLVRADAEWILDALVLPPGLSAADWQEAFQRRFLPSWTRYKHPQDTWRAAFLRVLRTLLHRRFGCTHEEAWTRFIILHRNTSASLNRIYSRSFDPLTIYTEIRAQNALLGREAEGYRQETRLVVALQDVNIFLLGTTADPGKSLFVNPNAYTLLHPPGVDEVVVDDGREQDGRRTVWAQLEPREVPPSSRTQPGTTARATADSSSPLAATAAAAATPTTGLASLVNKLRGGTKPAPAAGRSSNAPSHSDMSSSGGNGDAPAAAAAAAVADNEHRPDTGGQHRRRSSFLHLSLTRTQSRGGDTGLPHAAAAAAAGTSGQSSSATNAATSTSTNPGGGGGWTGLSLVRTRSSRTRMSANDGGGVASVGSAASSAEPADGTTTSMVGEGNTLRRRLSVISRTLSRDAHQQVHAAGDHNASGQQQRADDEHAAAAAVAAAGDDGHRAARGDEHEPNATANAAMDRSGRVIPAHASQRETTHDPDSAPIDPVAAADIHSDDDGGSGGGGGAYLAYPILTHPQPGASHVLYPNYTPFDDALMALLAGGTVNGGVGRADAAAGESERRRRGGNAYYMRDTRQGRLVAPSPARKYLPMSVPVGAEWEEGHGWRTWVGPVLLFAQLSSSAAHPSSAAAAAAAGETDPTTAQIIDGPIPPFDFGPPGMYASFDWADLDALAPWLELREVENGNDDGPAAAAAGGAGDGAVPGPGRSVGTHRAGLGFGR